MKKLLDDRADEKRKRREKRSKRKAACQKSDEQAVDTRIQGDLETLDLT